MLYAIMRVYRDEYGTTRQRRVNMREYKRLCTAKNAADANRGGYVIRVGSNEPVYVGSWPL